MGNDQHKGAIRGRYCRTAFGQVWIEEHGGSVNENWPPVLLVHGFAGSTRWWDRVVFELANSHHVVVVDLLGHGNSSNSHSGYDAPEQASALAEVISQLGVRSVAMVGHSLGTHVILALAEIFQRSGILSPLTKLVLVGQSPDAECATIPAMNAVLTLPFVGGLLRRYAPVWSLKKAVEKAFSPGTQISSVFPTDPGQPIRDVTRIPQACYRDMQLGLPRFAADCPLDKRIENLSLPTLVIFGGKDQFHDSESSCGRYARIHGVEVDRIPDVGHSPMLECPNRFLEIVGTFLSEH